MMNLDEVYEALQDRKPAMVAKATGLSYQTVWRIQSDKVQAVSSRTLKLLSDYLERVNACQKPIEPRPVIGSNAT